MELCNGCGGCCDPVVSVVTPLDVAKLLPGEIDDRTRRWYLEDLVPMSRREGLAKSPHLTQGGVTAFGIGLDGEVVIAYSMFYSCRQYDAEAKRCRDYENRPQPCRDYPFAGRTGWSLEDQDRKAALPLECGYRELIGQPVAIGRKP